MGVCSWFSSLECRSSSFPIALQGAWKAKRFYLPRPLTFHHVLFPGTDPGSRKPRCHLIRRQVRAIRVYGVPFLGVDARGFPGRRLGGRTTRPRLTGVVEARIPLDTADLVALAYPLRVRGCIRLCIRLPYPYVPHLLPPFFVALFYPSEGETLALSPYGFRALVQLLKESPYLLPYFPAAAQASPAHPHEPHQAVALVYGDQEVLPRSPHPIYQERLHVALHRLQYRVAPLQLLPGAQLQE